MSQHPYSILFVDDEEKSRKYFARMFGETYHIHLANDGVMAREVFTRHLDEIAIVVTDQRMPNETGTSFLEKVSSLKPSAIRILSTAFADVEAAVDAVNLGGIYRYVTKPWDMSDLEITLRRAMELFILRQERDELLRQKLASIEHLASRERMITLGALAVMRAEGPLRGVDEALRALWTLAETAPATPSLAATRPGYLKELYQQSTRLVRSVRSHVASIPAGPALNLASPSVPANQAARALLATRKALHWRGGAQDDSLVWPGPEEALLEVLEPWFSALDHVLGGESQGFVESFPEGLEFQLPDKALGRAFGELVNPVPDSAPAAESLRLGDALFRLAHHGAVFDLLPDAAQHRHRLRLSFKPVRESDPWESLVDRLASNEIFWSRYA